jgi:hypothetical protein
MNELNANTIYLYILIAIRFKINHRKKQSKNASIFKHNCKFILNFTSKNRLLSTAP